MGVEWSKDNQEAIDSLRNSLSEAESSAPPSTGGIQLTKYDYIDSAKTERQWLVVSTNVHPRFYNQNEDSPSKPPKWKLEIDEGDIDATLGHDMAVVGDRTEKRFTFTSTILWVLKFPDMTSYNSFWSEFNNKLFENLYSVHNTEDNRAAQLGKDYADRLFTEEEKDLDWDIDEEESNEEYKRPTPRASEPVVGKDDISLMHLGIKDNSYLVRGGLIDVLRNSEGAVKDQHLSFSIHRGDGGLVKPSAVMLADCERRLGMLSTEDRSSLIYADVETGKVVQEWKFEKEGNEIPMTQIVPETKNAPAEDKSTFLSFDANRLCRWDTRAPSGIVQEYSPELDLLGGKDYARNTNFTCMATAGDGSVAVGSKDGKVRLYSNKLTLKRASTAFPGIGTPITHIDVTYDGKWVVATTDHFIEVIKTTGVNDEGKAINGFHTSLSKHGAMPKLLKLRPEDRLKMKCAPLKKGRFTFVTQAGHQERWIVATCGNCSVLWNFRQVKSSSTPQRVAGGMPAFMNYALVSKDEPVVDSCFLHETFDPGSNKSEAALVVATPKQVWSFAE